MPRKKEGNPTEGFEKFLAFLTSPLNKDNFSRLTVDALGDDWPRHAMQSGGYDLSHARNIQSELREMLEAVIGGSALHLTPEQMLLIRLNALILKPRKEWTLTIGHRTQFKPTVWWKSLRICPQKGRGCRYFFLQRSNGRPKRHCGNTACRTRHDRAVRAKRTQVVQIAR